MALTLAGMAFLVVSVTLYGPGGCTCWEPVYDQPQAPHNGSFDAAKRPTLAMTALTETEPGAGWCKRVLQETREMLEELVANRETVLVSSGTKKKAWGAP